MQKDNLQKNSSQTFLKGAMIMSVSMIVVKLLGMVFKVMLTRMYTGFGDEFAGIGTGLLNNAYEVYNPLFTLATAGFPLAVSRLIAESIAQKRYRDVAQIHKTSKPFFIAMGSVCFVLMVAISFVYINIIKSPYSIYSMMTLAPSIFFGCLVSIYRGYYEGQRNMFPTAVSEVVEVGSKVVFGLSLAYLVMTLGMSEFSAHGTVFGRIFSSDYDAMYTLLAYSVAAAIAGISIGSILSFLFLKIYYLKRPFRVDEEYLENSVDARTRRETFNLLLKTAIPIGLAALVMSLSATIDTIVIQRVLYGMALNKGEELLAQYDVNQLRSMLPENPTPDNPITLHTYLIGCYSYAVTIMQLVTALTQAFSTSAMPSVTAAYTKGDKTEIKKSIETVLKLTMLFTLPAGLSLFAIPYPIISLLYKGYSAEIGAGVLRVMGISVIFIAVSTPICSMLNGVGRIDLPLKLYAIGMVIKILINYLFVSVVSINIVGAALGSLVAYLFVCVVGMYFLIKKAGVIPDFVSTTLKPLIGAVVCAGVAFLINLLLSGHMPAWACTLTSIVIAAIIYVIVLLILRTFTETEVKMLPKSKNIVTILAKLHLLG
ncbi:MAG: polysaccharide biosynthesis protein [Ruminococcus sp.]|nr:polysaccharide biosynthesis protein [Ruminococcus sp.]